MTSKYSLSGHSEAIRCCINCIATDSNKYADAISKYEEGDYCSMVWSGDNRTVELEQGQIDWLDGIKCIWDDGPNGGESHRTDLVKFILAICLGENVGGENKITSYPDESTIFGVGVNGSREFILPTKQSAKPDAARVSLSPASADNTAAPETKNNNATAVTAPIQSLTATIESDDGLMKYREGILFMMEVSSKVAHATSILCRGQYE
jgi:hypothetical protein